MQAAPPLIIDLTKMPRSAWFSLERFPLTLTPSPAEPESLRGISKVRNSLVPSGVRTKSSSSVFCKRGNTERDWFRFQASKNNIKHRNWKLDGLQQQNNQHGSPLKAHAPKCISNYAKQKHWCINFKQPKAVTKQPFHVFLWVSQS